MPSNIFRYDPNSTVGIFFQIRVYTEVTYDCTSVDIENTEIGGWNQWPAVVTSYYKINPIIEERSRLPCELPGCRRGVKWQIRIRYNIYLVADLGIGPLDADIHTQDPISEYAEFTTDCVCCDNEET